MSYWIKVLIVGVVFFVLGLLMYFVGGCLG